MLIGSFWKVFLWLVAVTLLSLMPADNVRDSQLFSFPYLDKIVHFIMYAILSFLLYQAILRFHGISERIRVLVITIIITVVYGGLMELVQLKYIPSRLGDLLDLASNAAGCICGILLFESYYRLRRSARS